MNSPTTPDSGPEGGKGHLTEDVCLGLILGLLSAREADEIMRHTETCPQCERLLKEQSTERERFRAGQASAPPASAARIAAAPAASGAQDSWWHRLRAAWQQPRLRWGLRGSLASAAAIALLVIMLLPGDRGDPSKALLGWLPPYGGEKRIRTQARYAPSDEMLAGLEAYGERDVARAAILLRHAQVEGPLDTMRLLYLGSSLAWLGEYEEATSVLDRLPYDLIPEPWSGESRWTLYVAMRGAGEIASADSLLRTLAGEPGEAGDRARQALDAERDR